MDKRILFEDLTVDEQEVLQNIIPTVKPKNIIDETIYQYPLTSIQYKSDESLRAHLGHLLLF